MTVLTKKIVRELPMTFDRRNWKVSIEPWGIMFKAKRSRGAKSSFGITWEAAWHKAVANEVERRRREKKDKKKAAKGDQR